ncbi:hypothetical protein IHV25_07250 [Phaeovibrio sulfidiphilus]|uniref:Uncharacterized protein n=1 Tax=Phaeovibrio sulfidiphilus TaxID=1220600 RepID=A0A8J7CD04_9PROT|nr:hypothetical protein [Phaeovibrio sulfidiphilus]MBE1237443.1 hypothetical protein [Phaeovibrio sulfidiphilus]
MPPDGFIIDDTPDFPFWIEVVLETDTHLMAVVNGKFGDFSLLPEPENWPVIPLVHDRLAANGFAKCKTPNLLFRNLGGTGAHNYYFLSVTLGGDDQGVPARRGSIRSAALYPSVRCTPPACQFRPPGFGPFRVSELAELMNPTPPTRNNLIFSLPLVLSAVIIEEKLKTDTQHPYVILKDFEDDSAIIRLYTTSMLNVPVTGHPPDGKGQAAVFEASLMYYGPGELQYEGEIAKLCGTRQDYLTLRSENRKNPCLSP